MINISDNVKNAYNKYTTQRKPKIVVGENEYFIQNMDLYADAYDEGNIVGNAIAKTLTFDIETEYVRGLDEFVLYDGIWTGYEYAYINLGTFKLFDEQGKDDYFSSITAYDKLVLFNAPYDPTKTTFPTTLYGLLFNICDQAGVRLQNTNIPNGNKPINANLFVEGETLKDILKAISQVSGNFAIISEDSLKLILTNETDLELSKYQISDPDYKRTTWKLNQVILGMKDIEGEYVLKQDDEDILHNGVHKIVFENNPFVYTQNLRRDYIDELYDKLHGFGYIAYETKFEGLPYIELGDTIKIDGKDTIILRYEIKSPDGLNSLLQAPSVIDSVVEYIDNTNDVDNRLRKTEYIVDKQNGKIEEVVGEVTTQNNKISQITQTVDEINSKISDIADITISGESEFAQFTLDNINQSEPIMIKVHPVVENISLLYPSRNLFPSNNTYLKTRIIRFENLSNGEIIDYNLPDDLLYYDAENYDEFYLDYDSKTCQIIQKCGYNEDGSVYILDAPIIKDYEYPTITLTDGNYRISLLGYDYGYLFIRLMASNIYTTQFATKVEVSSAIQQTADQINLEVRKKVDENEVISTINQSAEQITITGNRFVVDSTNFKLTADGRATCNVGEFGGWTISNEGLSNNKYFIHNNGYAYIYTFADIVIMRNYLLGNIDLNSEEIQHYDLNGDGVVNSADLLIIRRMILGKE